MISVNVDKRLSGDAPKQAHDSSIVVVVMSCEGVATVRHDSAECFSMFGTVMRSIGFNTSICLSSNNILLSTPGKNETRDDGGDGSKPAKNVFADLFWINERPSSLLPKRVHRVVAYCVMDCAG